MYAVDYVVPQLASFPGSPPARRRQTVRRCRAGGEPGKEDIPQQP